MSGSIGFGRAALHLGGLWALAFAQPLLDLLDEAAIHRPIGSVVPGDMKRAHRMAYEEVFHLAAAIEKQRIRMRLEKLKRLSRH